MNEVAICVATFGSYETWWPLASRALNSARDQTVPAELHYTHGPTLAQARNALALEASAEWLVFLDADDELDPRYVEMMLAGSGDIRQPSTLGIVDGRPDSAPVLLPAKPLETGNYVVIGAMIRRTDFLAVGGFDEWPMWEDWALWLKMTRRLGSSIVAVPDAVYRVHVRPGSRNQSLPQAEQVRLFREIERSCA